jgi:hypothetical protein
MCHFNVPNGEQIVSSDAKPCYNARVFGPSQLSKSHEVIAEVRIHAMPFSSGQDWEAREATKNHASSKRYYH